jgi:hypothetical protein
MQYHWNKIPERATSMLTSWYYHNCILAILKISMSKKILIFFVAIYRIYSTLKVWNASLWTHIFMTRLVMSHCHYKSLQSRKESCHSLSKRRGTNLKVQQDSDSHLYIVPILKIMFRTCGSLHFGRA